jgi:hypothetical protein
MGKFHIVFAAAVLAASSSLAVAEEHRELGPHEHGRGKLNIAIEGNKVAMELEVPGMDIVGFEHEANTDDQKAALEKAKATLSDVLSVFKMPAAAGCKLTSAKVETRAEDEHDHDLDAAKHKASEAGHEHHAGEGHHHSEFHAAYGLECAAPVKLTSIDFAYFNLFAGARVLGINLVTESAQKHFEVKREQPKLKLGEMG